MASRVPLAAVLASLIFMSSASLFNCSSNNLKAGFTAVPLGESNFSVERPYDLPLKDRYSFINGVHRMWVYSTDKPHDPHSETKPRTEIRISGYDYSSGVWQFEGYVYVPQGTTGTAVMQIHRATSPATELMLKVYDGELNFYTRKVVASNIYNRWMRVNVIHDVGANKLTVFVDGDQKLEVAGSGRPGTFDFKCGVYAQTKASHYMESRWRDIKILRKR